MCFEDEFDDPAFAPREPEDEPDSDRVRELSDEATRLNHDGSLSQERFDTIFREAARRAGERDDLLAALHEMASVHLLDLPE